MVVRNVSESSIFLKKGTQIAHFVSAAPVTPRELTPEMEEALGAEVTLEPLSVAEHQSKLLKKLYLSGLSKRTPKNAEAAEQLVFHDIFALERNELGCTSTVENEIHIDDSKPFKERFRHIPPPLLEEVHASLRDMLDAGAISPSQCPWCNAMVLVRNTVLLCRL